MKPPDFWQSGAGPWPRILAPLGCAYALAGRLERALARSHKAPVQIICVGNLTAGGSGKTPVAIAVAAALAQTGDTPHFLSRGYGGRLRGPLRVDPACHSAADVGDEPLLLAAHAPAWIARDRVAGAQAAHDGGAQAVILDDGFQDPALHKDVALLVADGIRGFGNGRVIPAGPLREDIAGGLARADALVIVGPDEAGVAAEAARHAPHLPILSARLVPAPATARLKGRRVIGFAGIGIPAKFRATLEDIGCTVAGFHAFADHHPYTEDELARLRDNARAADACLVTTAKDARRLGAEAMRDIRDIEVVDITATFADPAALSRVLGLSA